MLDFKRQLDEVIAIYSLESELLDIYVEGPTDKFIIENYLEYKNSTRVIIEIDDIDFVTVRGKYNDLDLFSNKDKLIAMSRIMAESNLDSSVKCVVDRDFDGILIELEDNPFVLYTDYSCIESYLLNEKFLKKLLTFGIKNFPHKADEVIIQISDTLNGLFILRMVNKHFSFNFSLPQIGKNLLVDKKTGECKFNFDTYLNSYLNTNKISPRKNEILEFIEETVPRIPKDIRFGMNGHDFVEILFNYVNKIKNTVNFRLENFERTVYLSIQPNHLEEYKLFNVLCS